MSNQSAKLAGDQLIHDIHTSSYVQLKADCITANQKPSLLILLT